MTTEDNKRADEIVAITNAELKARGEARDREQERRLDEWRALPLKTQLLHLIQGQERYAPIYVLSEDRRVGFQISDAGMGESMGQKVGDEIVEALRALVESGQVVLGEPVHDRLPDFDLPPTQPCHDLIEIKGHRLRAA